MNKRKDCEELKDLLETAILNVEYPNGVYKVWYTKQEHKTHTNLYKALRIVEKMIEEANK